MSLTENHSWPLPPSLSGSPPFIRFYRLRNGIYFSNRICRRRRQCGPAASCWLAILAKLFDAKLIGVSASIPAPPILQPYPGGAMIGLAWAKEQQIAEQEVRGAEGRFRSIGGGRFAELTWRGGLYDPAQFVACQARAADLIILGRRIILALPMQRSEPRRCRDGGRPTGFGHAAQFHPEADARSCPRRLEGLP